MPLFAATGPSSFISAGRTEEAAGLKEDRAERHAERDRVHPDRGSCHTARTTARTDRNRSEPTIPGTRGHRSTNGPANGAIRSTGRISATTTPLTPSPGPGQVIKQQREGNEIEGVAPLRHRPSRPQPPVPRTREHVAQCWSEGGLSGAQSRSPFLIACTSAHRPGQNALRWRQSMEPRSDPIVG